MVGRNFTSHIKAKLQGSGERRKKRREREKRKMICHTFKLSWNKIYLFWLILRTCARINESLPLILRFFLSLLSIRSLCLYLIYVEITFRLFSARLRSRDSLDVAPLAGISNVHFIMYSRHISLCQPTISLSLSLWHTHALTNTLSLSRSIFFLDFLRFSVGLTFVYKRQQPVWGEKRLGSHRRPDSVFFLLLLLQRRQVKMSWACNQLWLRCTL